MTSDRKPAPPRAPRAFRIDDPVLAADTRLDGESGRSGESGVPYTLEDEAGSSATPPPVGGRIGLPSRAELNSGIRWGAILVAAMAALASLAAGLWFARFVSAALSDPGWVGWTATGLLALGALAALVLVVRELVGLARLARLGHLRADADAVLAKPDAKRERALAQRIGALYTGRTDTAWGLARYKEHQQDVRDAGELLALADREILAPLDREARRMVLASAKRVATVTALSPIAVATIGFLLVENLALLRRLAALYGGRPGFVGSLRLARTVLGHLIAAGGVALTDDLLGQFLGQDLLHRLSRRLGEGAFNGALTARIGAAAVEITRPLPFIEAPKVRARDVLAELFRRQAAGAPAAREGSDADPR